MTKYQDYVRLFNFINKCNQNVEIIDLQSQDFEGLSMCKPKQLREFALKTWEENEQTVIEYFNNPVTSFKIEEIEDYLFFNKMGEQLKREVYGRLLNYLGSLSEEERIKLLASIYGFINVLTKDGLDQETVKTLSKVLCIHMSTKDYSNSWIVLNTALDLKEAIELACELITKNESIVKLNEQTVFAVTQLQTYIK